LHLIEKIGFAVGKRFNAGGIFVESSFSRKIKALYLRHDCLLWVIN